MTSHARVLDILLATARIGRLDHRAEPSGDPDDTLRVLAQHVDRAVLARRMVVTLDDGTSIVLEARHRRLLRYARDAQDRMPGAADGLRDAQVLTSEDRTTIAERLRALVANRTIRRVRFIDDPKTDFPGGPGLAASTLLDATEPQHDGSRCADMEDIVSAVVDATRAGVIAACVIPYDAEVIVAICGDHDSITAISDWAIQRFFQTQAEGTTRAPVLETRCVGCVGWAGPKARQLVFIRSPKGLGLILMDGSDSLDGLMVLRKTLYRSAPA